MFNYKIKNTINKNYKKIMNLNFQKARSLMVENQLRPNKIKDEEILGIFNETPKENFLPNDLESLSYSDMDITLSINRGYLKNLHIAQLIKYSEIRKNQKILHIGGLTGYVSYLLSNLCLEVLVIETDQKMNFMLKENINNYNINNIRVVEGDFHDGFSLGAPYDIIFIDTPIGKINEIILNQVSSNLGKIIMIEKENDHLSKAIKITRNEDKFSKEYLFDVFSKYELYKEKKEFRF